MLRRPPRSTLTVTLLPYTTRVRSASLSRSHVSGFGDDPTTRSYSANLDQTVFNWSSFANLRGQRALSHAADYDLEAAHASLLTRTAAAYFNVLVATEQSEEERVGKARFSPCRTGGSATHQQ